jgi:2-polyprenyl-3-methyl-5-hydroxy-6-metoxy-1,4-benzoquinol methylase
MPRRDRKDTDQSLVGVVRPAERWDSRYRRGTLDRLKRPDELAHYSLVVGYFQSFKSGGSILDVGCGEGILLDRLGPHAYSQYVGLDISQEAIRVASHKCNDKTVLRCADVNTYTPPERYDAVIFNESLYYFDAPLQVVQRYERCLEREGVFIICIVGFPEADRYWRALGGLYRAIDEATVTNEFGTSWTCKVLTTQCASAASGAASGA